MYLQKLTIGNLILLMFFIIFCGCDKKNHNKNDVEIICSPNKRFLIRNRNGKETKAAIAEAYNTRNATGYNKYVVLKYKDESTIFIKNSTPEEIILCKVVDSYWKDVIPTYISK